MIAKREINDPQIIPLLEEALAEPAEEYGLVEKKKNVLTTLGSVKWKQNKERLITRPRTDPEIQEIIGLLISARDDYGGKAHPYDTQARILKEMAQYKSGSEKVDLINEEIEVITEGLSNCVEDLDGKQRLNELIIETFCEINPEDVQKTAEDLVESEKDGKGYYTMALIEFYKNKNKERAEQFLNIALKKEAFPPGAIALIIEIMIQENQPQYDLLLILVEQLNAETRFRDTWKTAYHKGIVYTLKGRYAEAVKYFIDSRQRAPKTLQRSVQLFSVEKGRRKTYSGKIDRKITEREGYVYSHNLEGCTENIYFYPRAQAKKNLLQTGLFVDFELGFSPRGLQAFDVRPHEKNL